MYLRGFSFFDGDWEWALVAFAEHLSRRANEVAEEWVWAGWPRLELRVELDADEPRVVDQFHDLRQFVVR